jgi:hypothetical protein
LQALHALSPNFIARENLSAMSRHNCPLFADLNRTAKP